MARLKPPWRRESAGVDETIRDYRGREVRLTEERWRHIVAGHPEMDGLELAVKRVVESPDKRHDGKRPSTEVLYRRNLGPAKWLAVVVAYGEDRGEVLTAYPRTKDPAPVEQP